jgi:hypothetical protein
MNLLFLLFQSRSPVVLFCEGLGSVLIASAFALVIYLAFLFSRLTSQTGADMEEKHEKRCNGVRF